MDVVAHHDTDTDDDLGEAPLLRIATAGSVDDGKSTLIGRLLHDTKTVMNDHLAAAQRASERYGEAAQLALLTDGLRAEREQGITIDVAYRFFATPARSFIVADTPGHVQYTRNMVTGASTSDVAIVLVDARAGLVEQSRRHVHIAALMGVRHIVVAVNKMDLVDWDEATFQGIAEHLVAYVREFSPHLPVTAIPLSALHGDNVVEPSANIDWYAGPTLLEFLETVDVKRAQQQLGARLAVQWVIRPHTDEHHDYRGYAGRLAGGELRPGDEVVVLPSGVRSTVSVIDTFDGPLEVALPGQAVTVLLADDVDVSRGDTIVAADGTPAAVGGEVEADLCWMIDRPLRAGQRVWVKHGTRLTRAVVEELIHELDVNTLDVSPSPDELALNALGRVRLRTATPLVGDPYADSRETGRFIVIDEATNATAAAGMLISLR
jgi:sulfate adenylyltransferase large subunit